jgi:hypothetical protein
MPLIYTIGYQGRSFEDIRAHVLKLDAVLVDIRYAPYSPRLEFRRAALAQALERRYCWMQTLGNRAYKSGGPVEVVDYPAGRAILAALDKPAILMCACGNYQTTVARWPSCCTPMGLKFRRFCLMEDSCRCFEAPHLRYSTLNQRIHLARVVLCSAPRICLCHCPKNPTCL